VLRESFDRHQALVAESAAAVVPPLEEAIALSVERLRAGGTLLAFGNGGSAAQAQHLVTEIVGRYLVDRPAWRAVALCADPVAMSAVANDYGFERVFARQVEALGQAGDVVVAISTSGSSPNVVAGARAARARGCHVVALTGRTGGDLAAEADLLVAVPSDHTPSIQEVHLLCLHLWAAGIEEALRS